MSYDIQWLDVTNECRVKIDLDDVTWNPKSLPRRAVIDAVGRRMREASERLELLKKAYRILSQDEAEEGATR